MIDIADVMDRGLYYEDVQQLAREHDLPVSRTKAELIEELVDSGELDAEEVVAFVGVDMLRVFLQELGLPSGASRDVLADRLVEALSPRPKSKHRARRSSTMPALQQPRTEAELIQEPLERDVAVGARPINLNVNVPSSPPPLVEIHFPTPERPSAAWGFAGILMAGIVGATLYIGVAELGLEVGVLCAIVGASLLATTLLVTARWWVPWIDGLAR